MSPKHDPNAIGETRLIDGQVWVVVAIYPIRIVDTSTQTGK